MIGQRNIKLILSYDGTNYAGWQIQPNQKTVEGEVVKVLKLIHKKEVPIIASGRTDSGVHARGQVVNFKTSIKSLSAEKFKDALNSLLPNDIRVIDSSLVSDDFHSRYDAIAREYKYKILYLDRLGANRRYGWYFINHLDIDKLNRSASYLVGEHDFTTFATLDKKNMNCIRKIYSASFYYEDEYIIFRIIGNAFLWHMVRSIVGTLVHLSNNMEASQMKTILEAKDRSFSGRTAPPQGLSLERVIYIKEGLM